MKNYKTNHELNKYNYSEGIEFIGLIPSVMNAQGVNTIGGSEKSVKQFGFDGTGSDALEVIDVQGFMENDNLYYPFSSYTEESASAKTGTGEMDIEGAEFSGKTQVRIKSFTPTDPSDTPLESGDIYYIDSNAIPHSSSESGRKSSPNAYQLYEKNDNEFEPTDIWIKLQ